jgi:hypothetical protein
MMVTPFQLSFLQMAFGDCAPDQSNWNAKAHQPRIWLMSLNNISSEAIHEAIGIFEIGQFGQRTLRLPETPPAL